MKPMFLTSPSLVHCFIEKFNLDIASLSRYNISLRKSRFCWSAVEGERIKLLVHGFNFALVFGFHPYVILSLTVSSFFFFLKRMLIYVF